MEQKTEIIYRCRALSTVNITRSFSLTVQNTLSSYQMIHVQTILLQ
jgi:hypothetical protein